MRTANRREASSPRGKVREATERSGLVARLKPAERRAGGDEERRQHVRKAKHRKAAEFQGGRSNSGKSESGKSGAGRSRVGGSKARHGDAGTFRHR
ncbi:hypothetical protein ACFQY4_45250 [Catellatospora bangladeshensis]|uniref:hypothetical protein n=1 Tax=Catellatospora bangladeshensis TaxID=310355 RepID=UPI00361869FF